MQNAVLDVLRETTLSVENINIQKDTRVVGQLTEYFEIISDTILNKDIAIGTAFRNKNIRVQFAKIDKLIKDRFGINIKSIESGTPLGVQTVSPMDLNILSGNITNIYDSIKETLRLNNVNDKDIDRDDIDVRSENWVQLMKTYLKSVDAVERKLESDSITVDLVNAKIYGYPDKSTAVMNINPVFLITVTKLIPEELAAVFLHEIGHVFTHLEYSYRSIRNTTHLIESILDEVGHNKEPLEAIKLSYSKVFKSNKLDNSKNIVSVVVGITTDYITDLKQLGDNTYSIKDNERLADQFAARFGVGDYLGTSLVKFEEFGGGIFKKEIGDLGIAFLTMYLVAGLVTIFIPAIGLADIMIITAVAAGFTLAIVLFFVLITVFTLITAVFNKGIDADFPYDNPQRRIKRIRNDILKRLRTAKLSKDEIKATLSVLDALQIAAEGLNDKNEGIIYRMIGTLFKHSGTQNEMRALDDIIDDLVNNSLHVSANRFKTL